MALSSPTDSSVTADNNAIRYAALESLLEIKNIGKYWQKHQPGQQFIWNIAYILLFYFYLFICILARLFIYFVSELLSWIFDISVYYDKAMAFVSALRELFRVLEQGRVFIACLCTFPSDIQFN